MNKLKSMIKHTIRALIFLINLWLLLYIGYVLAHGKVLISVILFIIYVGSLIWTDYLLKLEIFYSEPMKWEPKLTDKEKLIKLKKQSSKYIFPEDLE